MKIHFKLFIRESGGTPLSQGKIFIFGGDKPTVMSVYMKMNVQHPTSNNDAASLPKILK